MLTQYKYRACLGWSLVLARMVLAHLESSVSAQHAELIVACPTYVGAGGHAFAHTELVVAMAARQDRANRWPFVDTATPAILKIGPTRPAAGQSLAGRRVGANALARVLRVPHPDRIRGRRILVYDDVLTTGLTLDTVAAALRDAGAAEVRGLVLSREPWRAWARGTPRQPAGLVAPT